MLRVTKLTDYATVVMTVLARSADTVLSASDLALSTGLEVPTVSKILKPLAQAGLIDSYRGANGGYRLARPADQIDLLQIVEAIEGPVAMTACSGHETPCDLQPHCGASTNWQWVNRVLSDALAQIQLSQMVNESMGHEPVRRSIPAVLQVSND